jgi:hypothetical protein
MPHISKNRIATAAREVILVRLAATAFDVLSADTIGALRIENVRRRRLNGSKPAGSEGDEECH